MSHKADCPFCKAFAVEVPGPSKEWLWQLPNDSPLKQLEAEISLKADYIKRLEAELEALRVEGARADDC